MLNAHQSKIILTKCYPLLCISHTEEVNSRISSLMRPTFGNTDISPTPILDLCNATCKKTCHCWLSGLEEAAHLIWTSNSDSLCASRSNLHSKQLHHTYCSKNPWTKSSSNSCLLDRRSGTLGTLTDRDLWQIMWECWICLRFLKRLWDVKRQKKVKNICWWTFVPFSGAC